MHALSPIGTPSLQSIYVLQAGVYLGPYSEKEVRRHWANGTIQDSDLLWQEGMAEWLPLRSYFGIPSPLITETKAGKIPPSAPIRPAPNVPFLADDRPGFEYQGHPAASAGWLVFVSWTLFGGSMLAAAIFHQKPMWVGLMAAFSVIVALIHAIRLRTGGSIGLLVATVVLPAMVWCLAVSLLPPVKTEPVQDPMEMQTPVENTTP